MADERRSIDLRLDLAEGEMAELERALVRAQATELGEVRRRTVRLTTGYGDATTRDVLDDESRRAQLRHDALGVLLAAFRQARDG